MAVTNYQQMSHFIKYPSDKTLPFIGDPIAPNYSIIQMGRSEAYFFCHVSDGIGYLTGHAGFEDVTANEVIQGVTRKFIPENHFQSLVS